MSNNTNYSSLAALSLLPPTSNPWITKAGDLSLYNTTLLLAATGLFQHATVFGFIFLLRGFSAKRALDLHFLTIIFASTFIAAPLIFLIDTRIDAFKLWFFLEHEAIEYIIAIRVLTPISFVKRRAGLIVLLCWTALTGVTVVVAINTHYKHGADIVAWGAFTSDTLLGITGIVLILRWWIARNFRYRMVEKDGLVAITSSDRFRQRKEAAEAMAGLGFMLHGFSTVTVAPILTRVLYHNLDPVWFAYAWVMVFFFAMFTVAFSVPSAALFFSTVNWCCWHDRKALPGEVHWNPAEVEAGVSNRVERQQSSRRYNDRTVNPNGHSVSRVPVYWTRLAEKHSNSLSPSIMEYD